MYKQVNLNELIKQYYHVQDRETKTISFHFFNGQH